MFRRMYGAGPTARIVPLALVAGVMALSLPAFRSGPPAPPPITDTPLCNLRHPVEARLVPLDPLTRGGTVRVALDVESSVSLSSVEARVVSTGGAALLGRARAELGTLAAGTPRRLEFTLELPATGLRHVLQVLITAESATGPMNRLAMLNILPDGPVDAGQVVTTPTGESIRQYTSSARRIDR